MARTVLGRWRPALVRLPLSKENLERATHVLATKPKPARSLHSLEATSSSTKALRAAEADDATAFRFFDLAPEILLRIYRELLIFTGRTGSSAPGSERATCYPAILTTCRQAYNEAKDILYEENTFSIDIGVIRQDNSALYEGKIAVNGRPVMLTTGPASERYTPWPIILLQPRVLHLKIVIKRRRGRAPGTNFDHLRMKLRETLHDLFYFLQRSKKLSTLHIIFDCEGSLKESHTRAFAKPLAQLKTEKEIKCANHNFVTEVEEMERLLVQSSQPTEEQ